jgi:hypothetical protein
MLSTAARSQDAFPKTLEVFFWQLLSTFELSTKIAKVPILGYFLAIGLRKVSKRMTPIATISPGEVFKANQGSNDYFTANQSNGTITLVPPAAGGQQGSIFKGTNRFLHTYYGSGTLGGNTFVGINAGNFSIGGGNGR